MSKKLLSSILAIVLIAVICCVPAFATENSELSQTAESTVSDTSSADVSDTSSADVSDTSSATVSDTSSADVSGTTSTVGSTTGTTGEDEATAGVFPWGLIIALAVIIVFVIVCIICIRAQNKFGVWLAKMLRDYKSEFRKISWLSPKELLKQTGVTLVILIIAAIVLGFLDWGFSSLISLLTQIKF